MYVLSWRVGTQGPLPSHQNCCRLWTYVNREIWLSNLFGYPLCGILQITRVEWSLFLLSRQFLWFSALFLYCSCHSVLLSVFCIIFEYCLLLALQASQLRVDISFGVSWLLVWGHGGGLVPPRWLICCQGSLSLTHFMTIRSIGHKVFSRAACPDSCLLIIVL